jgi:hypothetical protein
VVLPQGTRAQRMPLDAGGFMFVPLPPAPDRPGVPRTECTVLMSVDARRLHVPDSIVSFVLRVFAPLVYRSVLHVLQGMFHTGDAGSVASGRASTGGTPASTQRARGRSASAGGGSSALAATGEALLAKLRSRPVYGALARHVERHLVAAAEQAARGE